MEDKRLQEYLASQNEIEEDRKTLKDLKRLQRSVIGKLQGMLDGDELDSKTIQACTAAAAILKQNKVTIDPSAIAPLAGDISEDLLDSDVDVLPVRP